MTYRDALRFLGSFGLDEMDEETSHRAPPFGANGLH